MIYGDPCLKHFSVLKVTATKLALKRKKKTLPAIMHLRVVRKKLNLTDDK